MNSTLLGLLGGVLACAQAYAAQPAITELSLEDLLQVKIIGASKYEQKQSEVAAAVSVITRQEIQAFGWRTLSEALKSLPGVYQTYDRQYSYLGTRGFGQPGDYNTRVLLTINGNRVNDVVYDAALPGREFPLDMDLIERIEFIPGPGGAVYGQNALFGVINVITRTGAGIDGSELALGYQSPQSTWDGRLTYGRKLDNGLDMMFSATGFDSKGEDRFFDFGASGLSGVVRGLDGERDKKMAMSLSRGPWAFDLFYGDRRKSDPTGSFLSDPLVPNQYQEDASLLTQLRLEDRIGVRNLQFSARVFMGRQRYRGVAFYGGDEFLATGSSDWWGGEFRLMSTHWDGHKIMVGVDYQDNARRDQTQVDVVNPSNNLLIAGSGWRSGLYFQDEWTLNSAWSTTLGLRSDHGSVGSESVSPRAALIWKASPATTVKALYGRAYRAPNAYERDLDDGTSQVANPTLQSEKIDTLELVMDQRIDQSLLLRGSAFQWRMKNLIALGIDPVSGLSQYQRSGDVTANGLELSADKTWPNGARLRASVTLQDAHYDDGTQLANSPKIMGKLNASSPLPGTGLHLGYELQYFSKRETIISGVDTGGYALSNLNVSTSQWAKGLTVSMGIYNLFDKRYEHPASDTNWQNSLQQDGRQVRIKAVYQF